MNIGSGNGLVPSGTKPLPEPMLTNDYDPWWHITSEAHYVANDICSLILDATNITYLHQNESWLLQTECDQGWRNNQSTWMNMYTVIQQFNNSCSFLQCLPSGNRSCSTPNLISVCTLAQSSGGTSCGFTNIKSNWNMSRSDCKCSPVHKYWLDQSKWVFSA